MIICSEKLGKMSLFPAYANEPYETSTTTVLVPEAGGILRTEKSEYKCIIDEDEARLLATDGSDSGPEAEAGTPAPSAPAAYYADRARDRGNLPVSTLYYPGRPQYSAPGRALGATGAGAGPEGSAGGKRARRYFHGDGAEGARDAAARHAEAVAARTAHYQRLLGERPQDEPLWLDYVQFLDRFGGGALGAAEAACARCPLSDALRATRLELAQRALPADAYLSLLRDLIAEERRPAAASALWAALVEGLCCSAALCGAGAARDACAAAVAATRSYAPAYPHLLYLYGVFLRSAGLWEQLVLLLELVCAMNFPSPLTACAPSPDDSARAEQRLQLAEDQAASSGLPLSAVWPRVERMRAAAHWRPTPASAQQSDPQRAPLAADVADLLLPVTDKDQLFTVAVHVLRLARVPLLPGAGWTLRALHAGAGAPQGLAWDAQEASALLPLLWEGSRRPPSGPPPPAALRLLATSATHPHYFSDEHGFLRWTRALWASACGWFSGRERDALLCWRLRWHAALLGLLAPADAQRGAEVARVRRECRTALRAAGESSPLPCAEYARVEALGAGAERAADVALAALRAALLQHEPAHHRLYIARVACEVSAASAVGEWALVSAALAEAPPRWQASGLAHPPPHHLRQRALLECERRCAELEDELAGACAAEGAGAESACAALLPSRAEWAWARACLCPPHRLRELHARLLSHAPPQEGADAAHWSAARRRLHEEASAALVWAAEARGGLALHFASSLLPLHPSNARLALLAGRAPAWLGAPRLERAPELASPVAALGALLPSLLRAIDERWTPDSARRVCVLARRLTAEGGAGSRAPLLWALRLEAESARGAGVAAAAALYRALDLAPHCKELYVAGAWCAPGETSALADLLLEKQLRLHALPDELHAL